MAIKFREIRAARVYTDNLLTASGEPANTGSHAITGTLSTTGNATIGGTLTSTGTFTASGNAAVGGTLAVTGATTLTGALAANGGITCDTDKFVVADTTGATTIKATLTVGVNDTGHDVKFFGATAGKYMLWDESADTLDVNGGTRALGGIALDATAAGGVKALIKDGAGDILLATGTAVPADTTTGYAKGCLFIDTDVATGTTGLYCNKGTNTSCVFTAVTQA